MTRESVELIDRVKSRLEELADQLDRIQEFDETIEEHRDRVEAMSEDDQRSFYRSVRTLRDRVEDVTSPEELVELEEEITDAVQSPLQRAVRESIEEFLVRVDTELEGDERELIFGRLEDKDPSELESLESEYRDLTEEIDSMNATAAEVTARAIEDKPSMVHDPTEDLVTTVSRIRDRYEALKALEEMFDREYAGIPPLEFSQDRRFYGERSKGKIDVEKTQEYVDAIVEASTALEDEGIHAEAAVRNEFESWYESANILQRSNILEQKVDSTVDIRKTYENIDLFLPSADSATEYTGEFQSQIQELHQSHETLQSSHYDSLEEVLTHVKEVDDLMKAFFEDLYQQLSSHRALVDNVIEENPDLQEPDVNVAEHSFEKLTVKMHPYQALEDYQVLQTWIKDHLKTEIDTGDRGSVMEVWRTLSDGDSVRLTEENRESIAALADQMSLEVAVANED